MKERANMTNKNEFNYGDTLNEIARIVTSGTKWKSVYECFGLVEGSPQDNILCALAWTLKREYAILTFTSCYKMTDSFVNGLASTLTLLNVPRICIYNAELVVRFIEFEFIPGSTPLWKIECVTTDTTFGKGVIFARINNN